MRGLKYDVGQCVNVEVRESRIFPEPKVLRGEIRKITMTSQGNTYELVVTLWYKDQLDITRSHSKTVTVWEEDLDRENSPPKSLD